MKQLSVCEHKQLCMTENIVSDMFYIIEFTPLFCVHGVKHESMDFTAKNIWLKTTYGSKVTE